MHGKEIFLFYCSFYIVDVTRAIDIDYYMSNLRNEDTNCLSAHGFRNCQKKCHEVPVLCHEGQCYCHNSILEEIQQPQKPESSAEEPNKVYINIMPQLIPDDNGDEDDVPEIMLTNEALRPTLRHHIAHFCQDLEMARKCIRKCMKSGKPAFCGKDHTCYCGHKYSSSDINKEQNALDVYKGFADMYAKYLGGQSGHYTQSQETQEDNED